MPGQKYGLSFYQTCVFTCLLFLHLLHGLLKISSEWWSASDSRCMSSVFTFTLFPVFRLGSFFQCILFRSWDYTLQNTKTFFDKLCILWGCEQGTEHNCWFSHVAGILESGESKRGKVSQSFVICLPTDCLSDSFQNVRRANVQDSVWLHFRPWFCPMQNLYALLR